MQRHPLCDGLLGLAGIIEPVVFSLIGLADLICCLVRHVSFKNIQNIAFLNGLAHWILVEGYRHRLACLLINPAAWRAEQRHGFSLWRGSEGEEGYILWVCTSCLFLLDIGINDLFIGDFAILIAFELLLIMCQLQRTFQLGSVNACL